LIFGNCLPALAGFGLYLQGHVTYFDSGYTGFSYPEGQVNPLASANRDGDIAGLGKEEPWRSGFDVISTNAKGRNLIVTGFVLLQLRLHHG
jgi:hypothetical protein